MFVNISTVLMFISHAKVLKLVMQGYYILIWSKLPYLYYYCLQPSKIYRFAIKFGNG